MVCFSSRSKVLVSLAVGSILVVLGCLVYFEFYVVFVGYAFGGQDKGLKAFSSCCFLW